MLLAIVSTFLVSSAAVELFGDEPSSRPSRGRAAMELRREDSLGYQVNLLARLFERALREQLAAHGVVPGQFPALLCLYEQDGLTQAQIGARVKIEQPTIAKTLQRMEREGLIRRAPDSGDRRRVRIHLTQRARASSRRSLQRRAESTRAPPTGSPAPKRST